MAEVGVLNLTIHDNSESAGDGLNHLADALRAVKEAKARFSLEGVSGQVTQLTQAVKGNSSIISKLGTMFNAIHKFSQIKGFNINAEQLRDTALNMNKVADAMERQNEAVSKSNTDKNYWDNMLGNSDAKEAIKEAQRNVKSLDDLVKDAEASGEKGYANAWRTQMYSSGPTSRQSPGQIAMDIPELQQQVEGLKKVNETVEKSSEEYDRFKASVKGASSVATDARFDVKLASPIEALTSRVANCTETMQRFFDVVAHKPTTMSVASIEKATAENAKLAKAEIKSLIKTLQTPIKYKGLDEFVNTKTGVTSGAQKSLLNENTTMLGSVVAQQEALEREQRALMEATEAQIKLNEAGEAYAGVITVFDQAEGAFKKIQVDTSETAESIRNSIDLTQIPASGKNGAFANAAEEARYLQGEIEKTIASQQQWESIYNASQKQMKYGGPRATEDLEFDMRHAAEGYDIAYEAELRYKDAFAELLDYAKEYKVTAEDTIPVINEQASSIQSLSTNISTMATHAAANSSAIQQIFTALENPPQFKTADYINQSMGIGADVKSAEDSYRAFLDLMGQETPQAATLRELNPEMLQLKQQMDDAGISASQFTSKMVDLDGELKRKKPDAESAAQGINKFGFSLKDMKKGLKQAFPLISQLGSRLKSIIIRRTLTAAIRKIVSSAKEGIQNVYEYSKLIGSSFAPAMDGAASSLAQMKNSLGAALAPLLQMLIPVLQQVVSWFINLVNYANQFFSLLNGQKTWTRALPQTVSAFDKQTKAAKGAASAVKDLLADWDELNIIQSETGGGGSGAGTTAAEDYLSMFEEVSTFDNKVRDIVNFIKENIDDIWSIVKKIGIAILAWKLSSAFTGIIGTLAGLIGAALTIGIVFEVSTLFTNQYLKTGEAGWLVGDVLATLIGGVFAKAILGKVLGGSLASIAIPLTFAVSAAATIKALIEDTDVSVLSEESILTAITAGVEGGTAIGSAIFSLGGYTAGASIGAGIGGALFTFGVAIGLKAIATKLEVDEFTPEVIGANFLSAGAIGGGLFITELALGGGVVSALTLAGGGALLALAALFAIEAIIKKEPEKVTWGDYKATKQEIEEFVNNQLFTDPPSATVEKINLSIGTLGESKEQLTTDLKTTIGTIDALSVGILTTVDDMQSQVAALVKSFNDTTQSYQNTLEVAMTLVPVSGENGDQSASDIVKNSSNRWGALNEIMTGLGNELADAYKVAYDARLEGNIDEAAENTIKKISEMMTRVTNAIATGQSKARAGNAIRMQIENLSKETLDGILDEYKSQRDALIEELKTLRKESAEGVLAQQYAFEELAAYALKDAGGNTKDETYLYYKRLADEAKADYESLISNLQEDAEKAAEKFVDSDTMSKLRKFMIGSIANTFDTNDIEGVIMSAGYDPDQFANYIIGTLTGGNAEDQKKEIQEFIDSLLTDLVGEDNFDTYKKAIDANILSYGDLISEDLMNAIADSLGITGANREVWNKFVTELLGNDVKTPGLDNTELNSSVEAAKGAVSGLVTSVQEQMKALSGTGFDVNAMFHGSVEAIPVQPMATGGFVRSGDLIMANENGNIEMMGKMGNNTVVANNQQIVDGISKGVSQANGGVEARLSAIETMLTRILQKEFVARAVPSSGWGRNNAQSASAWDKVTG